MKVLRLNTICARLGGRMAVALRRHCRQAGRQADVLITVTRVAPRCNAIDGFGNARAVAKVSVDPHWWKYSGIAALRTAGAGSRRVNAQVPMAYPDRWSRAPEGHRLPLTS